MNRGLFLSILALDSYNRGYGQRLGGLSDTGQLGNATIITDALNDLNEVDVLKADFYAIAYDYQGQTVISYRGTDNLAKDAVTGYGVGAGFAGGIFAPQADLAVEFYTAVTERPAFYLTPPNAVVVGHSLGGGLAGLISMWTGVEGHGYDHMPFVQAGVNRAVETILKGEGDTDFTKLLQLVSSVIPEYGGVASKLIQLARTGVATPEAFAAAGLHFPAYDSFLAESVQGELLTNVRNGTYQGLGGTVLAGLAALIPVVGPMIAAAIFAYAQNQQNTTAILESGLARLDPYSTFDADFGVVELVKRHSQALLVILKYAETEGIDAAWHMAAKYILPALYEDRIGEVLGRTVTSSSNPGGDGLYALNDQLKAAIAYSAIDAGERPFGDQGIKAFFDDAVDLGRALSKANVSSGFRDGADELAQIVTQYAGRLAFAYVEGGGWGDDGVLALNAAQTVMSIDISDATWDAGKAHQEMEIIGLSRFIQSVVGESGFPINIYGPFGGGADGIEWNSPVRAGSKWLFNVAKPSTITARVSVLTTNEGYDGYVPGLRALGHDELALFVGSDVNDRIKGWVDNDFIVGGKGNDIITGGDGDDLLVGGEGDDSFAGGTGRNFFAGGLGQDVADYRLDESAAGINVSLKAVASADNDRKTDIEITATGRQSGGQSGNQSVNRMQGVETIILTDKADWLETKSADLADYVTGYIDFFGTTVTVDLSNPAGGNGGSDDFDTVKYLAGENGIFWFNGQTHGAGPISGGLIAGFTTLAGPAAAIALKVGLRAESLLPDDNLLVKGSENIILTDKNDRFFFTGSDFSIHSGYGKIEGGAGGDIIVYNDAKFEGGDKQLTIDGGTGNDWIYASGGERVVTAGGLGRDWIYNTSNHGELYGDIQFSNGETVADSSANADNFWYAADTTIMDAQHFDVLKFFGIPLTGGDAAAGSVGFALGALTGSLQVAAGVIGAANTAAFASGNKVFFDYLVPFITYKRDGNDLLVGNVADGLYKAVTGKPGLFNAVPDGDGGYIDATGVMRISVRARASGGWPRAVAFDFVDSYWGFEQVGQTIAGNRGLPPIAGSGAAGRRSGKGHTSEGLGWSDFARFVLEAKQFSHCTTATYATNDDEFVGRRVAA
jgi:RTX calcium-binding nonapeptide repeat (4 copies)